MPQDTVAIEVQIAKPAAKVAQTDSNENPLTLAADVVLGLLAAHRLPFAVTR